MVEGGQSQLDGLEKECHDELQKDFPQRSAGVLVPSELFEMDKARRRDLNVGTFGQGGAFVATEVSGEVIPILRNKLCVQRLGCRVVTGLGGNVAIPRLTATATAYSLPEAATLTKSTETLDQVLVTPHRVGAWVDYTRQLVLQSSVNVEDFLRDDLNKIVATKVDALVLQGNGSGSEPTGILNTTGVGSLNFGGTATWGQVVAYENALAQVNADGVQGGKYGWIVSPNTKNRWKQIAKTGVGVTSVVPVFLWDTGADYGDGTNDGRVNGYRAANTNQVKNDIAYFGNWDDVMLCQFGDALEMIVNPFTRDTDAVVRITVNGFYDVVVRRAASFCVSGDSGAQ